MSYEKCKYSIDGFLICNIQTSIKKNLAIINMKRPINYALKNNLSFQMICVRIILLQHVRRAVLWMDSR